MSRPPQPPSPPEPDPQWGPYGRPGQAGPYGGPQGWNAPPHGPLPSPKTNVLAIVAFVLSLTCIPLLALILGFIALKQIRERGEQGRGLAIAAITINCAAMLLALAVGVTGVFVDGPERDSTGKVTESGTSEVADIRVGDCFNTDDSLKDYDKEEAEAAFTVTIVPCQQAHEAEAYAVFDLDEGPYPGKEKIISIADERCGGTTLNDYVGGAAKIPSNLENYYYYPRSGNWDADDRRVTCFLGYPGGTSTGSVRATGS
ncbi:MULTISPECIES: DUF4190 domain-containing protein [unclassified Streptomyces]|uniref:DUF4190 domain-containing protein n=1 Tax=unclassified Streptomyces TaxID=2593676 RepID=UPI002883BE3D|nr:DUF4190 domain-containing protein [Streptomyces sp. DSM 41633]